MLTFIPKFFSHLVKTRWAPSWMPRWMQRFVRWAILEIYDDSSMLYQFLVLRVIKIARWWRRNKRKRHTNVELFPQNLILLENLKPFPHINFRYGFRLLSLLFSSFIFILIWYTWQFQFSSSHGSEIEADHEFFDEWISMINQGIRRAFCDDFDAFGLTGFFNAYSQYFFRENPFFTQPEFTNYIKNLYSNGKWDTLAVWVAFIFNEHLRIFWCCTFGVVLYKSVHMYWLGAIAFIWSGTWSFLVLFRKEDIERWNRTWDRDLRPGGVHMSETHGEYWFLWFAKKRIERMIREYRAQQEEDFDPSTYVDSVDLAFGYDAEEDRIEREQRDREWEELQKYRRVAYKLARKVMMDPILGYKRRRNPKTPFILTRCGPKTHKWYKKISKELKKKHGRNTRV